METVSRHGEKAREILLDAAEELFARYGIDAVSNRKIAEHAGTANHSAIKYHFGSRQDLLEAMLQRAMDGMRRCRASLPSAAACSLRFLTYVRIVLPEPVSRTRRYTGRNTFPSIVSATALWS